MSVQLVRQPITVMDGVTIDDGFDVPGGVGTDSFNPRGWLGFIAYVTATNAIQAATIALQYSLDGTSWSTLNAAAGGDTTANLVTSRDLSANTGLYAAMFGYTDPAGIFRRFPSMHTRCRLLITAASGGGGNDITGVTVTVYPIIDARGGIQAARRNKTRIIDNATVGISATVDSETFSADNLLGWILEGSASNTQTLAAAAAQYSLDGGSTWVNGSSPAGLNVAQQFFTARDLSAETAVALVTTVMEGPISEHLHLPSGHTLCRMRFTNNAGVPLLGFTVDMIPIYETRST